jgi:DNA primase
MQSKKKCYNWYLIGGAIFVVIVIIIIIISSSKKSSVPSLQDVEKAASQTASQAVAGLQDVGKAASQTASQVAAGLPSIQDVGKAASQAASQAAAGLPSIRDIENITQKASEAASKLGSQQASKADTDINSKTTSTSFARTTRQLLDEKCPMSISETRNGTVYINKSNQVTRDDYLFSGCNESKLCDTIILDQVSKNILDSIPSKGACGALDLGDNIWDANLKKWTNKPPVSVQTPPSSPERALTPSPMSVTREKTLKELLDELFSKKGEKINNVRNLIDELENKHKQNIQVIRQGSMVTMDDRRDRIRITLGGFDSNEIQSIKRG